ncbi:hypothetical protein KP509_15G019800 [Ceratopteris richardii]|uniref:Uncharacterized protein n=1 Tax=Ceratopteris richardii TaxID=49495 RepID=A0A8T2T3K6_CERRI|nr:hypothetical protein KP509_15G019800 [Ceratopteris richardii]
MYISQKSAKVKVLKAKDPLGHLKSDRRSSPRDHDQDLWDLSGSAWEEMVQEFMKLKKLKEGLAAETQQIPRAMELNRTSVSSSMVFFYVSYIYLDKLHCFDSDQFFLLALASQASRSRSALIVDLELEEKYQRSLIIFSLGLCENMLERIARRCKACFIGVPEARLGRVIIVSPSLVECSLGSLKRRVRFLVDEVGVSEEDVSKIVLLSPQLLTQKKVGLSQETGAKMITKHPQLLLYSIRDGFEPWIDFFRSLGLCDSDIALLLNCTSQVSYCFHFAAQKHSCNMIWAQSMHKETKRGLHTLTAATL